MKVNLTYLLFKFYEDLASFVLFFCFFFKNVRPTAIAKILKDLGLMWFSIKEYQSLINILLI